MTPKQQKAIFTAVDVLRVYLVHLKEVDISPAEVREMRSGLLEIYQDIMRAFPDLPNWKIEFTKEELDVLEKHIEKFSAAEAKLHLKH